MAKRHTEKKEGRIGLDRRACMKLVGGAAISFSVLGTGFTSATPTEYDVITVPAGEQRQFTVGSGETLANLLIDITADGADAQIVADGDDWTIRNVGFKGRMDRGSNNGGFSNCIKPRGTGTIDTVYVGDGTYDGVRSGGVGMPSSHSGHIEVRNSHVAEWTDNGLYNANAADNGGGTVHVDNCYFRDNNVAHLRVAAHGSRVENTVVHNTGNTPALPGGAVDATGVYTSYGDVNQVVEIHNCQIDCREDNSYSEAFWSRDDESRVDVYETQFAGGTIGNVRLVSGNGSDPDLSPPTGVPLSAEEAASGGETGSGDTNTGPSCTIVSPSGGTTVSGNVTVQVDASDSEDGPGSLAVEVSVDGESYSSAAYDDATGYYEAPFATGSLADGEYTLDARATDAAGATADAGTVTVAVDNESAPTGSIVSPSDGTTIGEVVTVQVDASDAQDDDTALDVAVSVDGGGYRTAAYNATSGYYEFTFDTASADGEHTLDARVTDSNGATTETDRVTVTVDNESAPTIDYHTVYEKGTPDPHAAIHDQWEVSDPDVDLQSVTIEVRDASGTLVDSRSYSVGGLREASSSAAFHIKQGGDATYSVTLRVTDATGTSTSDTKTVVA